MNKLVNSFLIMFLIVPTYLRPVNFQQTLEQYEEIFFNTTLPGYGQPAIIGRLTEKRYYMEANLLSDGTVLFTGGSYNFTDSSFNADLFDPETNLTRPIGQINFGRRYHTATRLLNGKVLIAGGMYAETSSEIYDPETQSFSESGNLNQGRVYHTATLLPNGQVLLIGGEDNDHVQLASAELYDPQTGQFTPTGNMATVRSHHTATLISDNEVLITGGYSAGSGYLRSAEIYQIDQGTFISAGNMASAMYDHVATRLSNNKVVIVGGMSAGNKQTQLFDPATRTFETIADAPIDRIRTANSLLNNQVLFTTAGQSIIFDPATNQYSNPSNMATIGDSYSSVTLNSGEVLFGGSMNQMAYPEDFLELYDPITNQFTVLGPPERQYISTANLLPDGDVLVSGYSQLQRFHPFDNTYTDENSFQTSRSEATATALTDGRILFVGGIDNNVMLDSAEIYDPQTHHNAETGHLNQARTGHAAAILPDGKVLVAGGIAKLQDSYVNLASLEIYDPETETFSSAGNMYTARNHPTLVALSDGKIMIIGGYNNGYLDTVELFDPSTQSVMLTGNLNIPREGCSATLLPNGEVLVVGGYTEGGALTAIETYHPDTGIFSLESQTLERARYGHSAFLYDERWLLLVGGTALSYAANPNETIDITTLEAKEQPGLVHPRYGASVIRLPGGDLFVVGGSSALDERYAFTPDNTITASLELPMGWITEKPQTIYITVNSTLENIDAIQLSNDGNLWDEWTPVEENDRKEIAWDFGENGVSKMLAIRGRDANGQMVLLGSQDVNVDTALPEISLNITNIDTESISLTFASFDTSISGIQSYEVFVHDFMAPDWELHETAYEGNIYTIQGQYGHRYSMMARATNNAGNTGSWKELSSLVLTPEIFSLSEEQVRRKVADQILIVNGINFYPESVVFSNDLPLQTTFIDSSHLQVLVPSSMLGVVQDYEITVQTPSPLNGKSNIRIFRVTPWSVYLPFIGR